MKFFKKFFWFFLILSIGLFCFNKPIFSQSATKVVEEFIKAGMDGDFEKLTALCCKYSGPYTTVQNIRALDLRELGYIEKIIGEKENDVDPDNIKVIAVRRKVWGEIDFGCFFVFKTPKGYKIYITRQYFLRQYPFDKKALSRIALAFYASNNLNLKKAIELGERLTNAGPEIIETHSNLAYLYKLTKQPQKLIAEVGKMIVIDPDSKYLLSVDKSSVVAACEELLKDNRLEVREKAGRALNKIGDIRSKQIRTQVQEQYKQQNIKQLISKVRGYLDTSLENIDPRYISYVEIEAKSTLYFLTDYNSPLSAPILVDIMLLGGMYMDSFEKAEGGLRELRQYAIPTIEAALKKEANYRRNFLSEKNLRIREKLGGYDFEYRITRLRTLLEYLKKSNTSSH